MDNAKRRVTHNLTTLLIKQRQPWKQSTGAKTAGGRSISKMNAYKHGARGSELRNIAKKITDLKKMLTQIIDFV